MTDDKNYSAKVQCPFYRRHTQHEIVCEGAERNTTLTVRYKYKLQLQDYMENFCTDRCYQGCPYYQLANEKYEDLK